MIYDPLADMPFPHLFPPLVLMWTSGLITRGEMWRIYCRGVYYRMMADCYEILYEEDVL